MLQYKIQKFMSKLFSSHMYYLKPFLFLDIVQNTFYKDRGAKVRFMKLSNFLAKEFPPDKLENLKFMLTSKWLLQVIVMIY